MSEAAATTVTPAATTPAAKTESAPAPSKAERRAQAVELVKAAEAVDEAKPAGGETEKPAEQKPEEKPAEERPAAALAKITKEHKKLLDAKKAHETAVAADKQMLTARKADLELFDKLKAGDFTVLEALNRDWYDEASRQYVAKKKPGDPSVITSQLQAKLDEQAKQIEELKNPKPKEPTEEEKKAQKAQIEAAATEMRTAMVDAVKKDARFKLLHAENADDVGAELYRAVDRLWIAAGKPKKYSDQDLNGWLETAAIKLEAALRAEKELTSSQGAGTKESAAGSASGKSGSENPQNITPRGTDTLTASLGESVPVDGRKLTKEERRGKAKALAREMFKSA